jgi:hypothetical protein
LCCAIQAIVAARHLDQPKGQQLPACGPEPASEWRVTPQAFPQSPAERNATIRPSEQPAMFALAWLTATVRYLG